MTGYASTPKCSGCGTLLMPNKTRTEWFDKEGNKLNFRASEFDNLQEFVREKGATLVMTCLKCGQEN